MSAMADPARSDAANSETAHTHVAPSDPTALGELRQELCAAGVRVIGLLGGIGSGKTLVAHQLAELGACMLDADQAGHEVLELPEVKQAVLGRWGSRVVLPDGRIDRHRLAEIVFSPSGEGVAHRRFLEQLTHPRIARRLVDEAKRRAREGLRVAVLDAPLLLEAGWDKLCDILVFVEAPQPVRLARVQARGWSAEELADRESAQESLDAKRRRADWVIDNSGSPQHTRAQIVQLWDRLVGR